METWQKSTADALMPVFINVTTLIKVICGKVVIKFQKEQKRVFTENNVKKRKGGGGVGYFVSSIHTKY